MRYQRFYAHCQSKRQLHIRLRHLLQLSAQRASRVPNPGWAHPGSMKGMPVYVCMPPQGSSQQAMKSTGHDGRCGVCGAVLLLPTAVHLQDRRAGTKQHLLQLLHKLHPTQAGPTPV